MLHNRYASNKEKRTKFVFEMMKNAMKPYEISEKYEEETIGEFENEVEENFFKQFLNLINKPKLILDLACGDGGIQLNFVKGQNLWLELTFQIKT